MVKVKDGFVYFTDYALPCKNFIGVEKTTKDGDPIIRFMFTKKKFTVRYGKVENRHKAFVKFMLDMGNELYKSTKE